MSVQFSDHAIEKARRRGVNVSMVHHALKSPDELYEDAEHGTTVAVKKVNEKSLILVYRDEDGVVKIITLYYTTKLHRLIRAKTVRGAWKKAK